MKIRRMSNAVVGLGGDPEATVNACDIPCLMAVSSSLVPGIDGNGSSPPALRSIAYQCNWLPGWYKCTLSAASPPPGWGCALHRSENHSTCSRIAHRLRRSRHPWCASHRCYHRGCRWPLGRLRPRGTVPTRWRMRLAMLERAPTKHV
eukprot:1984490-Amphidinium_carterae.2